MLHTDSYDEQSDIASIFFFLTMAWFSFMQTSFPHVAHMYVHTKHVFSSQSESNWLEDNLNASVTVMALGTQASPSSLWPCPGTRISPGTDM